MHLSWLINFYLFYEINGIRFDPMSNPAIKVSQSLELAEPEGRLEQLLSQIVASQASHTSQLQAIQHRVAQLESGSMSKLTGMQHELHQLKERMQEMEWGGTGLEGTVEAMRADLNALRQTWEYRQTTDTNQHTDRLPEVESKVNQINLAVRRVSSQVLELGRTIGLNIRAVAHNTSMLVSLLKNNEKPTECPRHSPSVTALPTTNISSNLPPDCWETLRQGHNRSGVYQIQPSPYHQPFMAVCDMQTKGGGWTVFQNREDGSTNFMRPWREFDTGFGNMAAKEFWLGLDKLHFITNARVNDLLVILRDNNGDSAWAYYEQFAVGSADQDYAITSLGNYHGSAGDSLRGHVHKFSAEDRDNDINEGLSCARSGAWWYLDCEDQEAPTSNLNGLYLNGSVAQVFPSQGILWTTWRGLSYSIPSTTMMVRPSADIYRQLSATSTTVTDTTQNSTDV